MRRLFVLLVALAAVAIAASPANAVLYGQPDEGEHPNVGVVRFFDEDGNYLWRCTGTLIAQGAPDRGSLHLRYGLGRGLVHGDRTVNGRDPLGRLQRRHYRHALCVSGYDDFATFPNTSDVGIVVLDKAVRLDSYATLSEPGLVETLYKHETFTIVGYGIQDTQPAEVADVRRLKATVRLISLQSGYSAGFNVQISSNRASHTKVAFALAIRADPFSMGRRFWPSTRSSSTRTVPGRAMPTASTSRKSWPGSRAFSSPALTRLRGRLRAPSGLTSRSTKRPGLRASPAAELYAQAVEPCPGLMACRAHSLGSASPTGSAPLRAGVAGGSPAPGMPGG